MSAYDIAKDYTLRGWRTVPIAHREKGPKLPGWQDKRIDLADLRTYFNGAPQNIGVLLGEPSGIIDVDLDHPIARDLADKFLPPTAAVFGRASSPRSHRIYRITGDHYATEQHKLANRKMIVEYRGTGAKTVFPGSTHTEGELIEWASDGEPAEVDGAELRAAVRKLADAVREAVGDPKPQDRSRQNEDFVNQNDERKSHANKHVLQNEEDVSGPNGRRRVDRQNEDQRASNYLAKMPPAISGSGGHDATYAAAHALVNGFGLSDDDAFALLWNEYNPRCEGPWSEREIRHKIDQARKNAHTCTKPIGWLRDAERPQYERSDFGDYEGDNEPKANDEATGPAEPTTGTQKRFGNVKGNNRPLPIVEAKTLLAKITGGKPYRVGSALFAPRTDGIDWLNSSSALTGWIGSETGPMRWKRGGSFFTKDEFYAELCRTAQAYDAVEFLPHVPPLPKHYYAWKQTAGGDGQTLRKLLDFFAPATPIDRDLLLALAATIVWGGPGGSRPAFVVTSDDGRGAGKSSVAKIMGIIGGGLIDFSQADGGEAIKSRLLSPDGLAVRLALLDNVKSHRFSWAELEALVTAAVISGKRLYVGEARRPNTLIWLLTLNGASLSTDLSQRCVIIKLAAPARSASWEENVTQFATENREAILGDLVAFHGSTSHPLQRYSRWATWEAAILSRLPEPGEAQRIIIERQGEADVERDEMAMIEDHFADRLTRLGYDAENEAVHIPSQHAAAWWREATGEPKSPTAVARIVNQLHAEGTLKKLIVNPSRTYGRGLIWQPNALYASTAYDFQERLRTYSDYPNGGH